MAVSIGPNDQRIGSVTSPRTRAQAQQPLQGVTVRAASAAEDRVSSNVASNQVRQERQAAASLLTASTSITVKRDALAAQEEAVEQIAAKLTQAEEEPNPSRRAELEQEAQEILASAQAQFDALAEQIPTVSQSAEFTAVLPAPASGAESEVVSISVAAAPSLADVGLSSISFDDPAAARSQLNNALDALRSAQSSLQSTSTAVAQTVQTRAQIGAALDSAGGTVEQPEQLAARLAETIGNLDTLSEGVDSIDVKSLLSEDDRPARASAGEEPGFALSSLTLGRPSLIDAGQEAPPDNATISRRAVTG